MGFTEFAHPEWSTVKLHLVESSRALCLRFFAQLLFASSSCLYCFAVAFEAMVNTKSLFHYHNTFQICSVSLWFQKKGAFFCRKQSGLLCPGFVLRDGLHISLTGDVVTGPFVLAFPAPQVFSPLKATQTGTRVGVLKDWTSCPNTVFLKKSEFLECRGPRARAHSRLQIASNKIV